MAALLVDNTTTYANGLAKISVVYPIDGAKVAANTNIDLGSGDITANTGSINALVAPNQNFPVTPTMFASSVGNTYKRCTPKSGWYGDEMEFCNPVNIVVTHVTVSRDQSNEETNSTFTVKVNHDSTDHTATTNIIPAQKSGHAEFVPFAISAGDQYSIHVKSAENLSVEAVVVILFGYIAA